MSMGAGGLPDQPGPRPAVVNRFVILGLGIGAQASTCIFLYGLPELIPEFRRQYDLSLSSVGWLVAAPTFGLLCALYAWGAAADRYGERKIMAIGLGLATVFIGIAAGVDDLIARAVLFGLGGAASASVNAASGRVVLGWFSPSERGKAMGARQTAQPLGVGIAALALPAFALAFGTDWALAFCAAACALMAIFVVLFVLDPPRQVVSSLVPTGSPYRTPALWRLHGASALLVVPQFAVSAFAFTFLVTARHWSPAHAGILVFVFQMLGAAGRVAAGWWSDAVDSRLRPMRIVAFVSAASMLAVAVADTAESALVVAALGLAAVISVADNGLGYTAAAELAGSSWSGRALGAQNTGQNVAAALTPPLVGALIGLSGYAAAFGAVAAFPLFAAFVVPAAAEVALRRGRSS
jgi:sugar phosphate permease